MKRKTKSVKLSLAQKRNWVKRLISCYTAGYRVVLKHYHECLTSRELANIEAMTTTGTLLLDNWTPRKEDN